MNNRVRHWVAPALLTVVAAALVEVLAGPFDALDLIEAVDDVFAEAVSVPEDDG